MRLLRYPNGDYLRIYYRDNQRTMDFLSALAAIGEALLRWARALGVDVAEEIFKIQKTGIKWEPQVEEDIEEE